MKRKSEKYEEAVERNLAFYLRCNHRHGSGKTLEKVKHLIGIKQEDLRFDTQITPTL